MRILWSISLVTISFVLAFVNESHPLSGALAAGAPHPETGAGWDNDADEDFPDILLDDEGWKDLKCKGDNLNKAMQLNDVDAGKYFKPSRLTAESPWDDFDDISTWGWHQSTHPDDLFQNFLTEDEEQDGTEWPGLGLDGPLAAFGLHTVPSEDPNNGIKVFYFNHFDSDGGPVDEQTYKVGSKTYRSTRAFYKIGIETSTGAMFALFRLSPAEAGQESLPKIEKDGLPELQRASDLAWLAWSKHAATKNKLKYLFNVAITNKQTQQAIRRVLKNKNAAFAPWPGATFDADSDEGRVLLGSPNGRGHGYLLAQHKNALGGNMYISKIQVFRGNTEPFIPNMVFHVEQPKPFTKRSSKRRTLLKPKSKL